jgi:hypothetical protein
MLTTPPVKKIDIEFPLGMTVTARNLKGVTIKDALDAMHKPYKKRVSHACPWDRIYTDFRTSRPTTSSTSLTSRASYGMHFAMVTRKMRRSMSGHGCMHGCNPRQV